VITLVSSRCIHFLKETNLIWFPPMGHIALRNNDVHCSLCFSETCANNICMQGISIESVKESFVEMEERLV